MTIKSGELGSMERKKARDRMYTWASCARMDPQKDIITKVKNSRGGKQEKDR